MHKIYPLCRMSREKCVRGGGRNGGQCDKWRTRKVADTNFLEKKIGCLHYVCMRLPISPQVNND